MRKQLVRVGVAAVLACAVAAAAEQERRAQTTQPAVQESPPDQRESNPLGLWNVEMMMEQATRGISQRYHLDEAQQRFTREFMKQRVKEYLAEWETETRAVLKELLLIQMRGEVPPVEKIRSLGERGERVLHAAKKAILDANMEWRNILDEEQKKIHDIDLRQMDIIFATLQKKCDRWKEGRWEPGDFGQRRPATASSEPPPNPPAHITRNPEDFWDIHVRNFIRQYELDAEQQTAAWAILKDCKEKAAQHRLKNKEEYDRLDAMIKEVRRDPSRKAEYIRLVKQRNKLDQSIYALFDELKARLEEIPRPAQRAALAQRRARALERAGRGGKSVVGATQPASSEVEEEESGKSKPPPAGAEKGKPEGDSAGGS